MLAPELAEEDGVGYDVNEVSADGSSDGDFLSINGDDSESSNGSESGGSESDGSAMNSNSSKESQSSSDEESEGGDEGGLSVLGRVCEGCDLSIDEGVLTVMGLFIKNRLEKSFVSDILQAILKFCLLSILCLSLNTCFLSM